MKDDKMFDVPIVLSPPARTESADVRRTKKRNALLARGIHPATRLSLREDGRTCSECEHCIAVRPGNRTVFKCTLTQMTSGPATDIRISWPACLTFAPQS